MMSVLCAMCILRTVLLVVYIRCNSQYYLTCSVVAGPFNLLIRFLCISFYHNRKGKKKDNSNSRLCVKYFEMKVVVMQMIVIF